MFLPPYSPDLNPIEQVFAKLKTLLRKAAERSVDAVRKRIGELLGRFSPHECANYLRNSGYNATQPENALKLEGVGNSVWKLAEMLTSSAAI